VSGEVVCEMMLGRGPASAGRGAGWEPPPGAGAAHVVFEGRPLFAVDQPRPPAAFRAPRKAGWRRL